MNIWILNHHAVTPDMSGGTRHYDFAKELIKRGHSITIIASSFHYSKLEEMKNYKKESYLIEDIEGIKFIWFKTPPYFTNGIRRVANMLVYTKKSLQILPKLNIKTPDVVIGSSVHLFAVYAAKRLAKRYKVPFIMEVRDLWPQTLIDMGMSRWHPFIIVLGQLEKYLYRKADKIITLLPDAHQYIEKFVTADKIEWISNGVDIENIQYAVPTASEKFTILYAGALGEANNLISLILVAERLKNENKIVFKIVGHGPQKTYLLDEIKRLNLTNISIENPVSKYEMSNLLASADVLFFNLKDSPVFKYGISSNKLFDYMAAGRLIIFASNASNNPVKEAGGGLSISADSIIELKDAIIKLFNLKLSEKINLGYNNRLYVEQNYVISLLVKKLDKILKEL
jgi:glycosyltransferase involved in cell wall biosynthesis